MKQLLLILAGFSVAAAAATPESPFACNRTALNPEQRRRHFDELGPQLRSLVVQARERSNGYEFQFPGDSATYRLVAEWTAGEHLCCPFFDIDIRLDREGGATWLSLTGRSGTADFIRVDFKAWFQAAESRATAGKTMKPSGQ
jgi:hypothetical protein